MLSFNHSTSGEGSPAISHMNFTFCPSLTFWDLGCTRKWGASDRLVVTVVLNWHRTSPRCVCASHVRIPCSCSVTVLMVRVWSLPDTPYLYCSELVSSTPFRIHLTSEAPGTLALSVRDWPSVIDIWLWEVFTSFTEDEISSWIISLFTTSSEISAFVLELFEPRKEVRKTLCQERV